MGLRARHAWALACGGLFLPDTAAAMGQVFATVDLSWTFQGRGHFGLGAGAAWEWSPRVGGDLAPAVGPFTRVRWSRLAVPTWQIGVRGGPELRNEYSNTWVSMGGVDLEAGWSVRARAPDGLVLGGGVSAGPAAVHFDTLVWPGHELPPADAGSLPRPRYASRLDPTLSLGVSAGLIPGYWPLVIEGRALRRAGAVVRPLTRAAPSPWVDRGRDEHASIAAFFELAAELRALGAPPALVGGALDAAVDEAEHAWLCFGLAARETDRPVWVAPLQPAPPERGERAAMLARIAVSSLVDGVEGEGRAADRAEARSHRDEVPDRAEARIAQDERRHAHLAGEIWSWARAELGAPIHA